MAGSVFAGAGLHAQPGPATQMPRDTGSDGAAAQTIPMVGYARQLASQLDLDGPGAHRIDLYRNGAKGDTLAVTMGLPFPPGMLHDAGRVQIIGADGKVIPVHVEPTLAWHYPNGGIRAVKVQFHVRMSGNHEVLHFRLGQPRQDDAVKGWPYLQGLVMGPDGVEVPGVLATLSPVWMSASMIAGPQWPALKPRPYDRYYATQYAWARKLPTKNGTSWLFDRTTTLFQQYVRTGKKDYLASALESYRFYILRIKRTGIPGWKSCTGGWQMAHVHVCDPKYIYIQPIKFALGLAGDAGVPDYKMLIERMVMEWDVGGWNLPEGPYDKPGMWWTERQTGLGLLAVNSAWEITGNPTYRRDVLNRVGWLYQHQRNNPDGLGDDGSWRNSWQKHEGETYNPKTDVRGSSPWMSVMIVDGLWHAWLSTGDRRIPGMIVAFGRYLEKYGWIDMDKIHVNRGQDWRNPCSGPNGQISWYWSSAHAPLDKLIAIQNSDGWYSDAHDVELMLPVAAARFFTDSPPLRKALDKRLKLLSSSWSLSCARNSATPRRFNWNNRGVGVVQWFLHEFSLDKQGKPEERPRTEPLK